MTKEDEEEDDAVPFMTSSTEYTPLPTDEGEAAGCGHPRKVALSASDKWRLVKPMIPKYMLPLCESRPSVHEQTCLRLRCVKFAYIWLVDILETPLQLAHQFVFQFEYTINQVCYSFCLASNPRLRVGRESLQLCYIRFHPRSNTPLSHY